MIPDAAVEAAARNIYESTTGEPWDAADVDDVTEAMQLTLNALEAAAPHLMAEAWDEGHASGSDDRMKWDVAIEFGGPEPEETLNPYRSQV